MPSPRKPRVTPKYEVGGCLPFSFWKNMRRSCACFTFLANEKRRRDDRSSTLRYDQSDPPMPIPYGTYIRYHIASMSVCFKSTMQHHFGIVDPRLPSSGRFLRALPTTLPLQNLLQMLHLRANGSVVYTTGILRYGVHRVEGRRGIKSYPLHGRSMQRRLQMVPSLHDSGTHQSHTCLFATRVYATLVTLLVCCLWSGPEKWIIRWSPCVLSDGCHEGGF
ncbi:hypothetical protein F4801DRAFT_314161 [Xylaria longipes]|nr:hypothetical protein F4801DRAFT_314161 [Xylaria longipes]